MSTTHGATDGAPAQPPPRQLLLTDTGRAFTLEATSPDGTAPGRVTTIRSVTALLGAVGDWAADAPASQEGAQ